MKNKTHYISAKEVAEQYDAGFSLAYAIDHLFCAYEFGKKLTDTQRRQIMRKHDELKELFKEIEKENRNY